MKLDDHPDPSKRWFHRRLMAYGSMAGALAFPLIVAFSENQAVVDIAWPVYALFGSVVGAYMGTAAWESITIHRNS